MSFKKGDIVRLKSGGPKMTVQNIVPPTMPGREPSYLNTQWFAGSTLKKGSFPFDSLEKVEDGSN
ncbi:DUF2158 domain-containing protein [Vibrio parahaemolyticus]|uniref:YodC family protein n=1 Tax=Vibrio parahaemolyticus TaxID=670 RepID=UPI00111CFE95|nr:DUF2158 domain-containing protein [Vibrio parahaemolyticus]MBC8662060.1 DUF2158 domain-containing protein [Vibrio parahaemolyticus]TOH49883.1 DUF2158 domain-containing protein [Vibrio parahaemolyticus]